MKLLQEFKEFAVKGNMIDMAIGIIIGASFNSVIDVLVKKILLGFVFTKFLKYQTHVYCTINTNNSLFTSTFVYINKQKLVLK